MNRATIRGMIVLTLLATAAWMIASPPLSVIFLSDMKQV